MDVKVTKKKNIIEDRNIRLKLVIKEVRDVRFDPYRRSKKLTVTIKMILKDR